MNRALTTVCLAVLLSACEGTGPMLADEPVSGDSLEARTPLARVAPVVTSPLPHRLIVKFADSTKARAAGGALALLDHRTQALAFAQSRKLTFKPLFDLPQLTLETIQNRAAAGSHRAQADLAGFLIAESSGATNEQLVELATAFQSMPEVEVAYLEPLGVEPPGDIAPTTPSFVAKQTYRGSSIGINVDHAWSRGAKGQGVRISDCEYGWVYTHEDLDGINVTREPGQTPHVDVHANHFDEHGTAVLGETSALDNAYGVTGLATGAAVQTFSEQTNESGYRRAAAIAAAVAASREGDVVMLEMQTYGANQAYVAAEFDQAVFTIVKAAVESGIIVVAAAGNGAVDLDGPAYAEYRARGNSGAILVGAGTPDSTHSRLSFSTYGARVDVQGFGQSAVSTGYGELAKYGGDSNQTYTNFSGTSSATPIVTSSVAVIQSYAQTKLRRTLTPLEMRNLLVTTGTKQSGSASGHIGPLPNLKAALDALDTLPPNKMPVVTLTVKAGDAGTPSLAGTVMVSANASDPDGTVTKVRFELPGPASVDDATAPYLVTFDTTTLPNGEYAFCAVAFDDKGARSEKSCVTVRTGNSNLPPAISFVSPDAGITVRGAVTFVAQASDPEDHLSKVVFTTPDGLTFERTAAPFSVNWVSNNVPNGPALIKATAFDSIGQSKAATLSVQISNQTTACANGSYGGSGLPLMILERAVVRAPLVVKEPGKITLLKVSFTISHSSPSNLIVTLVSPSGKRVLVVTPAQSSGTEVAFGNVQVPQAAQETAKGTWFLEISDDGPGDTGKLLGFSLAVTASCP